MQVLFKIKMSVAEYKAAKEKGEMEFPSYSDECAICHRAGCAVGHGYYYRGGYDIDFTYIEDVGIKRYLCRNNAKKGKEPVSFSLLISCFAPYRQYSLKVLAYCAAMWLKVGKKVKEALAVISAEHKELEEFENGSLSHIIIVLTAACDELRFSRKGDIFTLEEFINQCSENDYQGAEVLQSNYYMLQGGYKANSRFLFGIASQFRYHARDG